MNKDRLEAICSTINRFGKRLTLDAEEYLAKILSKHSNIDDSKILSQILTKYKDSLFITREILEDIVKQILSAIESTEEKTEEMIKHDIKIIRDPGKNLVKPSGIEDVVEYLLSRCEILGREIARDYGLRDWIEISRIPVVEGEQFILGVVTNKKISHETSYLEVEDLTGRRKFIVPKNDEYLKKMVNIIPLDTIIALKINARKNRAPIITEFYLPKVTPHQIKNNSNIYAILTSDLHIGSREFMYDEFERFIEILKGQVDDDKIKSIVKRVFYTIIAGDIVDGVGIYPSQKKDLLIEDIYDQYEEAYRLLKKLPDRIKVIISPGNHDATTKAIPRPPIFKEYAEKIYRDNKFIMVGDPVNIRLHDVNLFVFHGDFINDVFATTPGLTHSDVADAMDILLSVRHIAPTYGLQTRIMPQKRDPLIIPKDINILHGGHTHVFSYKYRNDNLLIINSGTWQKQTEYQKEMGMQPTPGIIPIINLSTLKLHILDLIQ